MRNISKTFAILVVAFALAGCVTPQKVPVVQTRTPFDPAQTLAALGKGANTVKGSALLRQQGGGVVTCAGLEVRLYPVTLYSSERMSSLYGSYDGGFRSVRAGGLVFEPNNENLYHSMARTVRCDAQGYFRFDEVNDGDFFLVTNVTWQVGQVIQGGGIMRKVAVRGGESKDVVLSAN